MVKKVQVVRQWETSEGKKREKDDNMVLWEGVDIDRSLTRSLTDFRKAPQQLSSPPTPFLFQKGVKYI